MLRDWLDRVLGGERERSLEPRPETRVIDGIPVHMSDAPCLSPMSHRSSGVSSALRARVLS